MAVFSVVCLSGGLFGLMMAQLGREWECGEGQLGIKCGGNGGGRGGGWEAFTEKKGEGCGYTCSHMLPSGELVTLHEELKVKPLADVMNGMRNIGMAWSMDKWRGIKWLSPTVLALPFKMLIHLLFGLLYLFFGGLYLIIEIKTALAILGKE
ncbi:hypothetical protein Taro_023577 [Colocasia esculenta]|uniref:Uncharacterized protein n=1 Tax=Colocasia esculenta TaxID=4460 RepID=A0A843V4I5_COLES|nr:hypothetical protein [Colocasia esculenta]